MLVAAATFVDVAGRYVVAGPGTLVLLGSDSVRQVAHAPGAPDEALTRAVLGNAHELDAAFCVTLASLRRALPAVCADPAIVAIERSLPSRARHATR